MTDQATLDALDRAIGELGLSSLGANDVADARRADADIAALQSLRDRLTKAEPACPHVVTSREGTSYCALAERGPAIVKAEPVAHVRYAKTGGNVGIAWHAVPTGLELPVEGSPLFTARPPPSISEAALLEALAAQVLGIQYTADEVMTALRSLGMEVGP